MKSHLGRALDHVCETRKITVSALAEAAGITQSVLSRACNGSRLEPKSLKALYDCQTSEQDALTILVAHLHDEISRIGRVPDKIQVLVELKPIPNPYLILMEEAARDPQLRDLLLNLASYVRTHPTWRQDQQPDIAAEDSAIYKS